MTTQTLVFSGLPSGLILTKKVFTVSDPDTDVTGITGAVEERENAKGQYVVAVTKATVITGDHTIILFVGSTPIAIGKRTFVGTDGEVATVTPEVAVLNTAGQDAIAEAVADVLSETLNVIQAKTNLITSSTRITIAANSGSSITLKCGDDYYESTAKRIEITDADSSLYDLLRDETLTARAFGAGIRRDAVTGTFSRDTITHTEASGSIPAYTTIFVECSVASDTPAGVTTYDIQITNADGRKHTPFSGQVTLVQDFKS